VNRTYVVTGSASGIGRATRARLEGQGARVIGVDLHGTEVVGDLSTRDGRAAVVDDVRNQSGGAIDAVICCAGLAPSGASEATKSRIDHSSPELIIRVNYFGTVELVQGLRRLLAAGTEPRVAVTASISLLRVRGDEPAIEACLAGDERAASAAVAGAQGETDLGRYAYRCSKRAVARWVRRVAPAAEWAGAGIPVNAIAPGLIKTPILGSMLEPGAREAALEAIPMPLNGPAPPEAPAALLAWLASPENTAVTGQVVFIDGGADAATRGDSIW
jgi:NAD(P)-dependent dehydrogenase (short-subunit alcohol dehydrogenase family)